MSNRSCLANQFLAHDYNWIISPHPESPESLFIATGGSGHSFKNLVKVGRYIVSILEGNLEQGLKELWRWRPERLLRVKREQGGLSRSQGCQKNY